MSRRPRAGSAPTAETLRDAAMAEFNAHGFGGTDSNRIARRAGFAPQTFYRWYKDKTEVFIACYRAWEDEERTGLQALLDRDAAPEAFVEAAVEHHRRYLMFRRSLRQLSLETPAVRQARAESRRRQIAQIQAWTGRQAADEELAVALLQMERLSDAIAENEFADMGFDDEPARRALAAIVARLRGAS